MQKSEPCRLSGSVRLEERDQCFLASIAAENVRPPISAARHASAARMSAGAWRKVVASAYIGSGRFYWA
jgi:hypothetical protein